VIGMLGMQIPEVALGGAETWNTAEVEGESRERGRGRRRSSKGSARSEGGGRRGRGGRDEQREPHSQRNEPAPEVVAEVAVAPEEIAEEEVEPQEVVLFERQRDVAPRMPAAARGERSDPRSERRGRGRDRNDDDDGAAPGETAFGDHVPAFMLRSSKVA
jgi:hypothetical protein